MAAIPQVVDTFVNTGTQVLSKGTEFVESGTSDFVNLLKDFNVIGFALGLIIAKNIEELASALIDGIIMPSLKPTLDRVSDKVSGFKIGSVTIDLNLFIKSIIKFIAIGVVIFIMMKFGVQIKKPMQWVSIRDIAPGVKLT